MARRLAHEIRNPLTPIQLSAERLQHKLSDRLEPEAAQMLERSTRTIIQQVDAMKAMVNAFSEYARPPRLSLAAGGPQRPGPGCGRAAPRRPSGRAFQLDLDEALPPLRADPGRLRQLLNNLIRNATGGRRGRTGG
ncbi:MAG: histidine kinase dimerization/phospho-acceptor domain-containing protein [Arhodomonas sp.]|nr:histidine kinase dimerization/phospho-acceptor domain-containing protein [Arhodomonas sp.]